jgi:hypothetical protein
MKFPSQRLVIEALQPHLASDIIIMLVFVIIPVVAFVVLDTDLEVVRRCNNRRGA